jgi:hypothetical protein
MSDGMDTFYKFDENGKHIEIPNVIDAAFNFKNLRGDFVKRRFNKFFKDMKKENIMHYDDISVASILYVKDSE